MATPIIQGNYAANPALDDLAREQSDAFAIEQDNAARAAGIGQANQMFQQSPMGVAAQQYQAQLAPPPVLPSPALNAAQPMNALDRQPAVMNDTMQAIPSEQVQAPTAAAPQQNFGLGGSFNAATQAEAAAIDAQGKADAEVFARAENAILERQKQRDLELQEMDRIQNEKQAELLKAEENEKAEFANSQKDFWADKSTGTKVAALIFQFIGGVGAGMQDKESGASIVLRNAIEQDTKKKLQRVEFAKDRTTGIAKKYDERLALLKDKSAVRDSFNADALSMAKLQVDKNEAMARGPVAKAKLRQLSLKFSQEADALRAAAAQKAAEAEKAGQELFVPALGGNALTKEDAQKLRASTAESMKVKDGVERLLQISETDGASTSIELRNEADLLAKSIVGSLREELLGPGTVSPAERAIIESVVGNPTKIASLSVSEKAKLNSLLTKVQRNQAITAQSYGIVPSAGSAQRSVATQAPQKSGRAPIFVKKDGRTIPVDPSRLQDAIKLGWEKV